MRYDEDTSKAFMAILDTHAEMFSGLSLRVPEFYFRVALTWTRERKGKQQEVFLSWSWLVWKGEVPLQSRA